ncbi:hypothetical protein T4A_10726 [Trichinella pseudospiralis]|uniref:Uncharacterized protein n=1 Tax=Trichinella pseudospiralis TaxID=6337 RepID=A0A0V1EYV2_TRIPS|nr:hypothetical protein T4A_10726 [Trichinella pseudospiralis]
MVTGRRRERILSNREGTLNCCFLNKSSIKYYTRNLHGKCSSEKCHKFFCKSRTESKQILKNHFTFHTVGEIKRTLYHPSLDAG